MKNKKIGKNYIYNLAYQIIIVILPIITTPYLSRVLGAENLGIYGYTISIVTYFTLFASLGIAKYGQREIAYVQDDIEKRSKNFWEINVIRLLTTIIASIIFYMFFCIKGEYNVYYRVLLLELISIIFDISWFFQGIEDFKKIVIRNGIIKIISVILIFILVKNQEDLLKYFIIYVMSNVIGNLTLWIKIKKYVTKPKVNLKDLKKHIKPMISLFIPQVATSIYTVLDKTMLGTLSNNISEVGFYEQSQKIVKVALTFVTTMSIVMMPRISRTYAQGDKNKIEDYMNKSFRFNWFFGIPIMFGIMGISEKMVPWFFGSGYEKVIKLIEYSSPIIIFIAFSTTLGSQYLISIKKQNVHTVAVLNGAICNIILNFILIPKYQSIGAVIATICAEFTITTIEILFVTIKKYIQLKNIFVYSSRYIVSGLIMYIIEKILTMVMKTSIINTFIQIIIGILVYCLMLIIIKDDFFVNNIKDILKKLKGEQAK